MSNHGTSRGVLGEFVCNLAIEFQEDSGIDVARVDIADLNAIDI
jgi:hypothetical protein